MLQQREQQFNKVLQEILNCTYHYSQISDIPKSSHEIIAKHFYALNLAHLELELLYPFSTWLIDKFQSNPPELIKLLSFLQWLKHPIQPHIMGHEPIIHQICNKPNALLILNLLFITIEPRHYQTEPHHPPYANPRISDEVFNLLIDNHFKYDLNSHPVFWALKNQNHDLLERILKIKPKWVDIQSDVGYTPLMMAIQFKNESGLLKLLHFNANPRIQNHQQESIAHILYRTQDIDWIKRLTEQPQFGKLALDSMIENIDLNQHIPLCLAISESMIPKIQQELTRYPHLRTSLYKCYTHAITHNRIADLDILYHHLELQFFDQPEIQIELLLKAKETYRHDILSWFLNLDETHPEIRKAMTLFQDLEKISIQKIKAMLETSPINWELVPAEISFSISRHLIKRNLSPIIAELQLFHLHPHFHTLVCPQSQHKTTILDVVVKTHSIQIHQPFIDYFLSYLDKYSSRYPRWLAEFHPNFISLVTKWSIPKNKLVNGSPLLHFIAQEDEMNQTQWLLKFINSEVQVNRFDKNGRHLFTNLLANHSKGFEKIKELYKNFPQFSLENLDIRRSNLLHLSIELRHIPCMNWCLSQNLSFLDVRISDEKNAFELAFDNEYLEIFDILKKHLKKIQIITFINRLITQNREDILQYLFSTPQPFDWLLSETQIKELKKLDHPMINDHLDKFYFKTSSKNTKVTTTITTVSAPKPTITHLNDEILMGWIRNGNAKEFEKLLLTENQPTLETLFENHFLNILELVFQSPNKSLNKIFIRIPAAIPKFEEHQAWLHLFELAVTTDNSLIFENLIGRKAILDYLHSKIIECIEITLNQRNIKWFNLLNTHFPLSQEQQKMILRRVIEGSNIDAFTELLHRESYQNHLIESPIEWIHKIIQENSAIVDLLFQFKKIETHIIHTASEILTIEQQQLLLERIIRSSSISALSALVKHESYQEILMNFPISQFHQIISHAPSIFGLFLETNKLKQHIIKNVSEILTSEQQQFLLQRIYETFDIPGLAQLLHIESYQYHLIESPVEMLKLFIEHDKDIFKLMLQFNPIEQHIIQYMPSLLSFEQQLVLMQHVAEMRNIPALTELLKIESYQEHLIHAPLELLHQLMNQDVKVIEHLLQFKNIEKHISHNAHSIVINGIKNRQKNSLSCLLRMSSFRDKLKTNPKELIEQVIVLNQMNTLKELCTPYFELSLILKPYIPTLKLNLPKFIKDAFKMGYSANQALFIFGSTIHHLLENWSFEFLNDIDFISSQPPPQESYQQSYVQPQLFFASVPLTPKRNIKFDYFVIPHDINHFIAEDYQQRDFTVNCLYCDKNGRVFDPTNLGLTDLRHRMIRSVQPSAHSFAHDPIRLLRAIKLMIKGFRLLPEVEEAMHHWSPNIDNMNFGHIYAMANNMLLSHQAPIILGIMIQFNLIAKLLRYEDSPVYENVLAFVNAESNRYKNISPKSSAESTVGMKK